MPARQAPGATLAACRAPACSPGAAWARSAQCLKVSMHCALNAWHFPPRRPALCIDYDASASSSGEPCCGIQAYSSAASRTTVARDTSKHVVPLL